MPFGFHLKHNLNFIKRSFLEFLTATAIYSVIGLTIGMKIKDLSIDTKDWLLLIPLYLSLYLIRMILVFICYPIFKRLPYGFTWKNVF